MITKTNQVNEYKTSKQGYTSTPNQVKRIIIPQAFVFHPEQSVKASNTPCDT